MNEKEITVYRFFYETVLAHTSQMLVFSPLTYEISYPMANTMLSEYMYFITPFI